MLLTLPEFKRKFNLTPKESWALVKQFPIASNRKALAVFNIPDDYKLPEKVEKKLTPSALKRFLQQQKLTVQDVADITQLPIAVVNRFLMGRSNTFNHAAWFMLNAHIVLNDDELRRITQSIEDNS